MTLAAVLAALPATASASELLSARLASATSVTRACSDGLVAGADGVVKRSLRADRAGWVTARLEGNGAGDWDLAMFDAASGALVAGSSNFGMTEVATGVATAGERLTVQACRISGRAASAAFAAELQPIDTSERNEPASLVRVSTPNRARKDELMSLGLDPAEHATRNSVDIVLYGGKDARVLREHKFVYIANVPNLVEADARERRADASYAARVRASALPSGRDRYRRYPDFGEDMKKLVRENPGLVKPITLPFKTWEGRTVEGIEITTGVNERDGKPIFMNVATHHAREWPSAEHSMEWAFELVNGYKAGNPRVRKLVENTRTVVIPLVNPDGFNASREAGELQGGGGGREGNETANLVAFTNEYRRKNCRMIDDSEAGSCAQPSKGLAEPGVDPNRNYGMFWGGNGASGDHTSQTYWGPGPFSEPETQNIRDYISKRHVTTLITNHTFSNLVLRPPGVAAQGEPADEAAMKDLGDRMARENGYFSQHGYDLYDTTGTTEDWSYNATGGFGYTFEIGCAVPRPETQDCEEGNFHPSFAKTVGEYEGTTNVSDLNGYDGKGNREAYFLAQENTADASKHSVLSGAGPGGAILRLKKSFDSPTSQDGNGDGQLDTIHDDLNTTMEMPGSNRFEWHINPSTRPLVAKSKGRPAHGSPSPDQSFSGAPGPDAAPCANFETPPPECYNDHVFEVPGGAGVDNAFVTIRVEWSTPASDWDLKVFKADAGGNAVGAPVGNSGQSTTDFEQVTLGPDPAPGQYVARVQNWAAAEPYEGTVKFAGPDPFRPAETESWRLTCESFSGTVLRSQDVVIARGERKDPGLQACTAAFNRAFATGRGCDSPTRKVYRKGLDRARLGRSRSRHLRSYKIGLKGRRGLDKFCLKDKSSVRIGYPQAKVLKQLKRKERRGLSASKAGLIITSSKRFSVRKVRVGSTLTTLRKRIGRVRGIRIGRNTWYVKRGARARLVYKVRGGKVREVGEASLKLTSSRKRSARLLKSFRLR